MIVYAIHQKKIFNTILPKNIDGNYTLKDENEDGKERTLLNIVSKDNHWVISTNKSVDLYENGVYKAEIVLEDYRHYEVRFKKTEEIVIVYTCPVMEKTFTCFTVDKTQSIVIGNQEGNGIKYNSPFISPRHSVIGIENNRWVIKVIDARYATYINDEKINGASYINNGDVIFIMGLKITIVDDKMWVNNPNNQVFVSGNIFKIFDVPDNNIKEEYEERSDIKLYNDKDYFSRVSQFYETVETTHFILDDAPSLDKPKELPVILTIGPMLTMSMTSVSTLVMSFLNYQNNQNKNALTATIVMSVAMLAGTIIWPVLTNAYQKRKEARDKERLQSKYISYLENKDAELNRISTNQLQILMANNISSLDAYNMVFTKNQNLWRRDIHQKDFLNIKLGIGRIPLNIDYTMPEEHFKPEDDSNLYKRLKGIIEKYENIENAPIIESLTMSKIVSIIGRHDLTKKYVDNLLLQLLFLHSYYDLKVVLFTEPQYEKEWSYLKKAPHTFDNNKDIRFFASNEDDSKEIAQYLLNVINSRIPENDKDEGDLYKSFDSYYLIITDNYESIKDYPLFEKIFKTNSNIGFSVIIVNNNFANLPIECHKFIGVNSETEGGLINSELSLDNQKVFQIEQVGNVDYDAFCVALANIPIIGQKSSFKLPTVYNFLEMYESGNVEQLNSLERWRYNDPVVSLSVPIGVNSIGSNFKLDLHEKAHGPHGLIAGMTGSGKSDFIISYILSMSVNFHPDEVQFVLIDYKGGGLVGAFTNKEAGYKLPHLAGTITNLEKSEIDRTMVAIQTELERRQELFNSAKEKLSEGTIDIYKYQKYYREGLIDVPLSHLFIISDEFAELKSQEPDFMDLLISTARIGRSLGVHLILATQKPSGVVNDQIWSNARFKVCLKVQDANDSNEVIKRPDAAYLKEPGRFYLQVGFNEIFDIGQAAYAESSYIPKEQIHKEIDDNITFINNIGRTIKTINLQKNEQEKVDGEELINVVKYLSSLSEKEHINTRQLWLDPLPKVMYYDDIVKEYNYEKTQNVIEAIVGVYDDPARQRQSILTLNFTKLGNAVIYSSDERNTIMDTILYSLISNYTTNELNIFALDFDGQTLKVFADAPQVGDVLFISETEKIERLFRGIFEEIEKRKVLFQDFNGSYDFYINNSGNQLPAIIFIIHGYENFKETFDEMPEEVEKIAREGARYGIYLIITAVAETALRANLRNNMAQTVPLKLTTQTDYNMMFGKKAPIIKDCENRGVIARGNGVYEFQTAYISEGENRRNKIINKINQLNETSSEKVLEIKTLPQVVTFKDILVEQLKFNKLPIGLETETLNVSYYDITKSLITTITASNTEKLITFAYAFYKIISKFKNINILLYDMNDYFASYSDVKNNTIDELDTVVFDPERKIITVVFVTGVSKWLDELKDEDKKDLEDYFNRIADLKNCIFIFVDKIQDIKTVTYDNWFKKYVPNDRGIYIGKGINDDSYHSLNNSYKELNENIPDNYGYNIYGGMGTRIQVVEDISDGK